MITMNKMSFVILNLYMQRQCLTLNQLGAIMNIDCLLLSEPVNYLRNKGYLRINPTSAVLENLTSDGPIGIDVLLEITYEGKIALESEQKLSRTKRLEWLRYIITTFIAAAAFIKSFFF